MGLPVWKNSLAIGFDHFYNLEYDGVDRGVRESGSGESRSPVPQDGYRASRVVSRDVSQRRAGKRDDRRHQFLSAASQDGSEPKTERSFSPRLTKRSNFPNVELNRNPRDKTALHARAVAFAFRSNWNFLVRKAWRDSLSDATAARKLEDQILAIDPNDPDAPLGEGVHEYIIGGLPWAWRTLGFLVGFHGDKAHGLATVEKVARYGNATSPTRRSCCARFTGGIANRGKPCLCSRT